MSLRLRLLLATAVVALLALVGADIATYELLQSSLYRGVDSSLQQSHQSVEASISHEPSQETSGGSQPPSGGGGPTHCPSFDGTVVDTEGLTPGTVIEVRSANDRVVYRCHTAELGTAHEGYPALPATITGFGRASADRDELSTYFTAEAPNGDEFRVRASILTDGPAKGDQLIVAVPLADTLDVLDTLRNLELVATGVAIVGVVALGFWLVRVGLRPLRDVERTAGAIAAGQLTERVPGDDARTEVGRVAHALNVMLERIEGAFAERDRKEADLRASEERMRRFVADASHELRTPLAAVTAYAELFDRGAAERPEDLRRVLRGIQQESSRMRYLVEDLLLLAHLDEGRPLVREPTELVELAADAVDTARAVGPDWPVELVAEQPVQADVDGTRIRQVLDNLLGNVRVHTPQGTTAIVTVTEEDGVAVLEVADNGPGLTPDDARRIFERFFRADPSRSRAQGGAGLGLAIVDAIVSAHGGAVEVASRPAGGARFTVRLPKHAPDQAQPSAGAGAGAGSGAGAGAGSEATVDGSGSTTATSRGAGAARANGEHAAHDGDAAAPHPPSRHTPSP